MGRTPAAERRRTPAGIAEELEHALAQHAANPGAVGAAWGRRATNREQMLIRILAASDDPLEHGGRVYSLGLDGELRVTTVPEEDHP